MAQPVRIATLLSLLALLHPSPARAVGGRSFLGDDTAMFTFRWEPAGAVGDLRNVIDQPSLEGLAGDLRVALGNSNFSLGVGTTWNRFYGGTPHTVVSAVAPVAMLHVYLTRSTVQPYLGVAGGGMYTRTSVGSVPYVSKWGLCADPRLGMLVTVTPELALDISVHYQWTNVQTATASSYQWAGVGVGFALY